LLCINKRYYYLWFSGIWHCKTNISSWSSTVWTHTIQKYTVNNPPKKNKEKKCIVILQIG
jgi:hypothetical protein